LAPTDASHLTRIKAGGGVFIAYATDAGSVALEGESDHSPFTQALLKNLKKPISIDDMFSLVTREVSLVTKGMQRPYKYASLENIVCLTGTCSGATPAPATDIVQEAQRSESDELQIALQTNNRNALESYLEKYPESSERQKVLAEIGRLKRSEFTEWTFYELGNGRPQYLKFSSIRQFGDRVAYQTRSLADPDALIGAAKYPEGTYSEGTSVIDCKQSILALADTRAVDPSGNVLGTYKWADSQFLNMSVGIVIEPGTVGQTTKFIVCNDKFRTPLVSKKQLSSMNFSDLATTPNGDGEIYYQVIQGDDVPKDQRDAIVLYVFKNDVEVASTLPALSTLKLGTYKTGVSWNRFSCQESKFSALKTEMYDASNELKSIMIADLSKESIWTEIKENSPLATLRRILCGPNEVQK
jgi:caspase domain-containing protein